MSSKKPIEQKIWKINGYSIHLEYYDSEIIVKDENGNRMRISKKNPLTLVLDMNGSFISN